MWVAAVSGGDGATPSMPVKRRGRGEDPEWYDWDGGASWTAHPDEGMRRTSHLLATDAGAWLVDPIDAEGLDERVADAGGAAGVTVLASFHGRDAATLAARYDVPVTVAAPAADDVDLGGAGGGEGSGAGDVAVRSVEDRLPGTEYEVHWTVDDLVWSEAMLWDGASLVATETLSTAPHLTAPGERLAVMPLRRAFPPREALGGLAPDRVLVGHGAPVLEDTEEALATALDDARRRLPLAFHDVPTLLRASYAALRD